jgi:hypothetical protein
MAFKIFLPDRPHQPDDSFVLVVPGRIGSITLPTGARPCNVGRQAGIL